MINDICSSIPWWLCGVLKNAPSYIMYLFLGVLVLRGALGFLADTIPQVEVLKAKVYLPLAKKRVFKVLTKSAIKADIRGSVNSAVMKMSSQLPSGWLRPIEIDWVQQESSKDFLNDDEIVIRIRPVEDQDLNFITAVYYFLRKSFFPKTKAVIPDTHREASVLFTSRKIIGSQKPELTRLFEDQILEPEINKDDKILDAMHKYENLDNRGYFAGIFLREIHAVASEARFTPLRGKMKSEVNEILKHIKDFNDYYIQGATQNKWSAVIPADMWTRKGPITNYGFLLVARPWKVSDGPRVYVNKAKEKVAEDITRLYVLGNNSERDFAEQVIQAIASQVPEYKFVEKFDLSSDYRGNSGGVGALFEKM